MMHVRASFWVRSEGVVRQTRNLLLQNPLFHRVASDDYLGELGSVITSGLVIVC